MVSLPENYQETEQRYPTLYMIDGDFQFQHVSMVANNLARMGKIPPMIVIGIANQGNADYVYQTTWSVKGEPDFGGAQPDYVGLFPRWIVYHLFDDTRKYPI